MKKKDELAKPNSCFNKAKDNTLIFVLIEDDGDAPETIRDWCRRRVFRGKNKPDDPKIKEALDIAEEMEMVFQIKAVEKARAAIVAKIGPWVEGSGNQGTVDCPICGKAESLKFRRAGINGHIHASCPGCVSWME